MAGTRSALWLGPDEWLLLAPASEGAELAAALARAAEPRPYSLVDVSHRQIGISGMEAAAALNVGCPLDLDPSAFPPGTCTRTALGKSEVVR